MILLCMSLSMNDPEHPQIVQYFHKKNPHYLHQVKVELPKTAEWVLKPEQSTESCHGKALNSSFDRWPEVARCAIASNLAFGYIQSNDKAP